MEINARLGKGVYTVKDIATILRLPLRTVRRWVQDYWDGILNEVHHETYYWKLNDEPIFNFYALIEFYTFYQLKKQGLSNRDIVKAYTAIAKYNNTKHPFATSEILTDGGSVLFKYDDETLIDADPGYKTRLSELLKQYCQNIVFDNHHLAMKLYPLGKKKNIVIDPKHQFGQPTIEGTNIYPETIFHLYKAGERLDRIAVLYDISLKQVTDAIDYCKTAA